MPARIALTTYELKKQKLIAQFRQFTNQPNLIGSSIRLYKQTSNLFRSRSLATYGIDVRQFNHVIDIDQDNLIANVEGMTTYETLVNESLKYHCLPTIVPELKTITIGGALAGCGIESSSFKYGLVHETISEFEVLLGDGRIVLCQPNNDCRDLWSGFPNSYGTLGYALRIQVALYPVKPYVKLTHIHITDTDKYFKTLKEICLNSRDDSSINFVEGVAFDKHDLYITIAQFVDNTPYLSDYTYKNIYFRSIKQRPEDYLTIKDYIWRWDTDWFWCSKFFYAQNPVIRALLGKKRLTSSYYWRIRRLCSTNRLAKLICDLWYAKSESVIQDVQIPIEQAAAFLSFFEDNIGIKPIWLCPTMPYRTDNHFDLYAMTPGNLYINFGFWDLKPFHEQDGHYNRLIEKKVSQLSGKKSLYSTMYYTKDEFWHIYNEDRYKQLKDKYDPNHQLWSLYDKCNEK